MRPKRHFCGQLRRRRAQIRDPNRPHGENLPDRGEQLQPNVIQRDSGEKNRSIQVDIK